ncbi:hypothetical protein HAX54_022054, partial [Datura stramonium]|nr:hypothetical protein [Datura stramonium]
MQESGVDEYLCPSFNNFGYLAEIGAKMSDEFRAAEEEKDSFDGVEDFEFSLASTVEFMYDDQIKFQPIFPVFNRSLLLNDDRSSSSDVESSIRIALKNLFVEEGESTTSDELETIPPGTYCVWKPTISEPSPAKCKKSKSTGSVSKRWPRIRDFLRRSNSDSFLFLTPKNETGKATNSGEAGKLKASVTGRNKGDKNRRKSYLPYRKDLIGLFAI